MQDRIPLAIGLRIVSAMTFTLMGALIKLAEEGGAGLIEMLFCRQLFSLPVVLAVIAAEPGFASLRTTQMKAHWLRTIMGLASMGFMFSALFYLPLAEATVIQFTMPIFATILGVLVLKEPTGWHRWGAVVAGFIGVLIVAQPGSGHIPVFGAALGLAAAFLSAGVSIQLRRLGGREKPTSTVFYFGALSLVPLALPFLLTVKAHDAVTWAILIAIGLIGGVGQLLMTRALAMAPVAVVVPIDYSSLIWAALFGYIFFDRLPTPMTWVGAPIVIGSGLYILWREHRRAQRKTERVSAVE